MLKETPLIEEHRKLKAKFMHFHGFKLPLEFHSARMEHLFVRERAGLFDVSHMGELRVAGDKALAFLEKLLVNNPSKLKKNQAQYNMLCNEKGGVIDDLILYCLEPSKNYLLCVNAGRIEIDKKWLNKHLIKGALVIDESEKWAQMALQGPQSYSILAEVLRQKQIYLKKNQFDFFSFEGEEVLVFAGGYTGEKGFEIFISPQQAPILWRALLEKGKGSLLPSGLLARDTLRLEMKYPLYGVDLDETRDPYSAGFSWMVDNFKDFIGSLALKDKKQNIKEKWVGFHLLKMAGVPRFKNRIFINGNDVGEVTSGAKSPNLDKIIGLAYVPAKYALVGQQIEVEIHQNRIPAEIVSTPFIKKGFKK